MDKYRLTQPYPNRKIGDIAFYTSYGQDAQFLWEDGGEVPLIFQPHIDPDWFEKVSEEKKQWTTEELIVELKAYREFAWKNGLTVNDLEKFTQKYKN